jgi:hypothetical protein
MRNPTVRKIKPRTAADTPLRVTRRAAVKKEEESGMVRRKATPRMMSRAPMTITKAHRLMPIPGCSRSARTDGVV